MDWNNRVNNENDQILIIPSYISDVQNQMFLSINIGIKHDFLCINICWAQRKVLKPGLLPCMLLVMMSDSMMAPECLYVKSQNRVLTVERWAEWGLIHDNKFTLKYHIHNSRALCFDMQPYWKVYQLIFEAKNRLEVKGAVSVRQVSWPR